MVALNDHIKLTGTKSKTRKYRKALYELQHQVERRKLQLQNLADISRIMHKSHNVDDIVKAAEALQRPFVVETMNEQNPVKKKLEKGETQRISLQMFKKRNSISEIAKERNLTVGTIEGHLAGFVATGEVDILDIVSDTELEKISTLVKERPTLTPSELKKQLGDDYSYGQIKAVMNYRSYRTETQDL